MGFGSRFKKLLKSEKKNEKNVDDEINAEHERNFKYLDDLIHSGIKDIVLDSDIILDSNEKSKYEEGIKLDVDDLVIDGNGHAIDANKQARIFLCAGNKITIKNITFKQGFARKDGGSIFIKHGDVNIYGAEFLYNISEDAGGAIFNMGALNVLKSSFKYNMADVGGAIYNSQNKLKITKSILDSNTSKNNGGGAIYNMGDEVTVMDCEITNNTAKRNGGAIANEQGEINIINSILNKNTSNGEYGGGAIANMGEININKSTINENTAKGNGGAIANIDEAVLNVLNSTLLENISQDGKAIHGNMTNSEVMNCITENESDEIITPSDVTKNNPPENKNETPEPAQNNFKYLDDLIHSGVKEIVLDSDIDLKNNERSDYPEGIAINSDNIVIDGDGHTIDAHRATRIFHITGKNITLKNITLKGGFVDFDRYFAVTKSEGGLIKIVDGDLTIINCKLIGGEAQWGGAVYNFGRLKVINSTISNNSAESQGGAIYNRNELNIEGSTLSNNKAKQDRGGAIYNSDGDINIKDSTLSHNSSEGPMMSAGGAIDNGGRLHISGSTLTHNSVTGLIMNFGGAIANSDKLTIKDSTLTHNSARQGGAIRNIKHTKIIGCEISDNESSDSIIYSDDSTDIQDCIFTRNSTPNLISNLNKSNLSIFNVKFIKNSIADNVIYNDGKSCTIERGVFDDNLNSADAKNITNQSDMTLIHPDITDSGKSILNEGNILIKNSQEDVISKIGGKGEIETDVVPVQGNADFGHLDKIIHDSAEKKITLTKDICFESYEKEFYEGGIELDIDDLIIDGDGHAIDGANKSRIFLIIAKNITLKNITFKNGHTHENYNNTINNHGGAIRNNCGSNLTIENCRFINNISEENGGSIHNNGSLTLTDCELTENMAHNCGGAILNQGAMNISTSKIHTNKTTESHGGAIMNTHKMTIDDSFLNDNTSSGAGGAIVNMGGELNINNSTLKNHTSDDSGGAIINFKGIINIKDSIISDNTSNTKFLDGGGAICHQGEFLNICNSTISNNTAAEGGGLNIAFGTVNMYKTTFKNNTATINGGAIFDSGDEEINLIKCEFEENEPNNLAEDLKRLELLSEAYERSTITDEMTKMRVLFEDIKKMKY